MVFNKGQTKKVADCDKRAGTVDVAPLGPLMGYTGFKAGAFVATIATGFDFEFRGGAGKGN